MLLKLNIQGCSYVESQGSESQRSGSSLPSQIWKVYAVHSLIGWASNQTPPKQWMRSLRSYFYLLLINGHALPNYKKHVSGKSVLKMCRKCWIRSEWLMGITILTIWEVLSVIMSQHRHDAAVKLTNSSKDVSVIFSGHAFHIKLHLQMQT